jgi:hypothetical protein
VEAEVVAAFVVRVRLTDPEMRGQDCKKESPGSVRSLASPRVQRGRGWWPVPGPLYSARDGRASTLGGAPDCGSWKVGGRRCTLHPATVHAAGAQLGNNRHLLCASQAISLDSWLLWQAGLRLHFRDGETEAPRPKVIWLSLNGDGAGMRPRPAWVPTATVPVWARGREH